MYSKQEVKKMQSMERFIAEYDNRANREFDFYPTQVLEIIKLSQDETGSFNMLFDAVVKALKAGYVIGAKSGGSNPN